jgi:integrase
MALSKQAKILTKKQVDNLLWYVGNSRNALRNRTIVLLSVRAGLRAKEIAGLKLSMITDAEGNISDSIHLTDEASKGRSGRIIPLNMNLRHQLEDLLVHGAKRRSFEVGTGYVITTERAAKTSAQAIVTCSQLGMSTRV